MQYSITAKLLCRNICNKKSFQQITQKTGTYPANICLDEDVLKTSFVFVFRRRLQDVFKTNMFALALRLQKTPSKRLGQHQYIRLGHTSSRRLQDVFKTFSRRLAKHLQEIFMTSSRCLQDIFKTTSKRLQHVLKNVFNTPSGSLEDVLKTPSRHLQDVLQRYIQDVSSS